MTEWCATVCQESETDYYTRALLGEKVFQLARSKQLDVPGFPDISSVHGPPSLLPVLVTLPLLWCPCVRHA